MSAANWTRKRLTTAIYAALAAVTLLVYLPVLRHEFVHYDDTDYITENPHVTAGLTRDGVVWAFTTAHAANWHPLTWLSHMLDCQLYGLHPAGHHLTNVLLHTANALLLFFLLNKMTGALWRSALVAALFAWHPLHVESVAWAAERKDVLSALFWMLTLITYTNYAQKKSFNHQPSTINYLLALLFFACGLMSKPMVVTLPCVLLLLDFWPLRRIANFQFSISNFKILLLEKIPFFVLSAGSCFITLHAQAAARWPSVSLPLDTRLANAVMSCLRYLSKMFWPVDLALIYPYPHRWPAGAVILAAALLAAWTALFLWRARRHPHLAVGWLWYLGTLVPAIGLVQVGVQSMADRYTYLPSIGIFILVVWGANDLLKLRPQLKRFVGLAAGAALAGCLTVTSIQLNYWQNSVALFWHTIQVTTDNYSAYNCLGSEMETSGKLDAAESLYADSVRVEPDFALGQFHLGMMRLERGDVTGASNHLAIAARLTPNDAVMQFDFGTFLARHGQPAEAAAHLRTALHIRPDFPEAQKTLADLLAAHPELK